MYREDIELHSNFCFKCIDTEYYRDISHSYAMMGRGGLLPVLSPFYSHFSLRQDQCFMQNSLRLNEKLNSVICSLTFL